MVSKFEHSFGQPSNKECRAIQNFNAAEIIIIGWRRTAYCLIHSGKNTRLSR